jgi:hypothetical protein
MKVSLSAAYSGNLSERTPFAGLLTGVAISLCLLLGAPAYAQGKAACPQEDIKNCTRYQRLDEAMDSGDFPTQLASLRAASEELDPSLRSLIFGKALKSSDLRLRTAAIRYVLASKTALDVSLEAPPHPTPEQERLYGAYRNFTIRGLKVNEQTDEISGGIAANAVGGSIIRGGFEINVLGCRLRMNGGEEDVLKGVLQCRGAHNEPVDLAATVELG